MKHGGKRNGAGRPVGSLNKATSQLKLTITELAQANCHAAIKALIDVAQNGKSEAARVSAANSILDRGFGRPIQSTQMNLDSEALPTVIQLIARQSKPLNGN